MSSLGTITPVSAPRTTFDVELDTRREDHDVDYSGWFCVQTDPWSCPAPGCDFVALYMTAAHLIVVWPSRDDPYLLGAAQSARVAGREPRIVEYEQDFGPCIAWDEWSRLGKPVHAFAAKPDGWDDNARDRL